MALSEDEDRKLAGQARVASLVIAGSMIIWLIAQWVGPQVGLAGNYAILIDLFVLAALFWALVVAAQIWRKRRQHR